MMPELTESRSPAHCLPVFQRCIGDHQWPPSDASAIINGLIVLLAPHADATNVRRAHACGVSRDTQAPQADTARTKPQGLACTVAVPVRDLAPWGSCHAIDGKLGRLCTLSLSLSLWSWSSRSKRLRVCRVSTSQAIQRSPNVWGWPWPVSRAWQCLCPLTARHYQAGPFSLSPSARRDFKWVRHILIL